MYIIINISKWSCEWKILLILIEKLPEGLYLATSEDIQGLVAQGRTVTETIEIARDVAKKLLEAQSDTWKENDITNIKFRRRRTGRN